MGRPGESGEHVVEPVDDPDLTLDQAELGRRVDPQLRRADAEQLMSASRPVELRPCDAEES